ncbi:hypothetical protein P152DRAFT_445597 [Eremomyces bilateralis CBS 781.70]|uniref:Cytochrome P450 n=1 Tax=Eremomyces bilateralis CBS 781.70 TaxID=1392243 RepID=A0A6G1GHU8_9PEZI|nr:uncharacterized protein P152DRAFT_445597 [Eremomyces bilateralis CBS 781.70]KAF1817526.1 hypothetical protein P152DRAFT_445597 [Eremomyces bilateralis CBS 781.70]
MAYSFGSNYNYLGPSAFNVSFDDAFAALDRNGSLTLYFPWLYAILYKIPDRVAVFINPSLAQIYRLHQDLRQIITSIIEGGVKATEKPTIFHEIVNSKLPEDRKSPERLSDEALGFFGAAISTTAWALSTTVFHILDNPEVHTTLHEELLSELDHTGPNSCLGDGHGRALRRKDLP